jgi:hypothetical protein
MLRDLWQTALAQVDPDSCCSWRHWYVLRVPLD